MMLVMLKKARERKVTRGVPEQTLMVRTVTHRFVSSPFSEIEVRITLKLEVPLRDEARHAEKKPEKGR